MDLAGRVGLVTGGATGIGRATVLQLAKSGAAGVAINYRTADFVEVVRESTSSRGVDRPNPRRSVANRRCSFVPAVPVALSGRKRARLHSKRVNIVRQASDLCRERPDGVDQLRLLLRRLA